MFTSDGLRWGEENCRFRNLLKILSKLWKLSNGDVTRVDLRCLDAGNDKCADARSFCGAIWTQTVGKFASLPGRVPRA